MSIGISICRKQKRSNMMDRILRQRLHARCVSTKAWHKAEKIILWSYLPMQLPMDQHCRKSTATGIPLHSDRHLDPTRCNLSRSICQSLFISPAAQKTMGFLSTGHCENTILCAAHSHCWNSLQPTVTSKFCALHIAPIKLVICNLEGERTGPKKTKIPQRKNREQSNLAQKSTDRIRATNAASTKSALPRATCEN